MTRRWFSAAATLLVPMLLVGGALACSDPAVTATSPVKGVSLSPPNATLNVGSSLTLSADVRSDAGAPVADASVFWSTSDSTVAAVNASGTVTARKAGQATIAATALGVSAVSTVVVRNASTPTPPVTPPPTTPPPTTPPPVTPPPTPPPTTPPPPTPPPVIPPAPQAVATVTLAPSSMTLEEGDARQVGVTLRNASGGVLTGRSISWTSSNDAIATVSATGLVRARKRGSATITATSEGKRGTVTVNVIKD